MTIAINLIGGLLFGLGLIVSGLTNPAKVLNFLDLSGSWDPSLAFTMATAVVATALGFRFVLDRPRPVVADRFYLPTLTDVDAPLIFGAALFGTGWGLVGYCPGPALATVALGNLGTLVFVIAMIAGMVVGRHLPKISRSSPIKSHAGDT